MFCFFFLPTTFRWNYEISFKVEKLNLLDFSCSLIDDIPKNKIIRRVVDKIFENGEMVLALCVYSLAKEHNLIIYHWFVFRLVKTLARKNNVRNTKNLIYVLYCYFKVIKIIVSL